MEPTRATYLVRRIAVVAVALALVVGGVAFGALALRPQPTVRSSAVTPAPQDQATAAVPTADDVVSVSETDDRGDVAAVDEATILEVPPAPLPARSSRLIPQAPERVLDTRNDQPPSAGDSYVIRLADERTAAALSVSLIGTSQSGSVVIDGGAGATRALSAPSEGMSTTNLVILPVVGNELTVRSTAGGHLVVDLVGTFERSEGTGSGRLVTVPPVEVARLVTETDGRETELSLGNAVPVDRSGPVLVAITADVGADGGMVRLGASDGEFDQMLMWGPAIGADRTRRGLALLQPGSDLSAYLRYDGGTILTAEVIGYFTAGDGEISSDGLYVPSGPRKLFSGDLDPDRPLLVDGIEALAVSALITVDSPNADVGTSGSYLLPVRDESISLRSTAVLTVEATLLGVFLGT